MTANKSFRNSCRVEGSAAGETVTAEARFRQENNKETTLYLSKKFTSAIRIIHQILGKIPRYWSSKLASDAPKRLLENRPLINYWIELRKRTNSW